MNQNGLSWVLTLADSTLTYMHNNIRDSQETNKEVQHLTLLDANEKFITFNSKNG